MYNWIFDLAFGGMHKTRGQLSWERVSKHNKHFITWSLFSKRIHEGGGRVKKPKNLTTWFLDNPCIGFFSNFEHNPWYAMHYRLFQKSKKFKKSCSWRLFGSFDLDNYKNAFRQGGCTWGRWGRPPPPLPKIDHVWNKTHENSPAENTKNCPMRGSPPTRWNMCSCSPPAHRFP